MPFILALDQGTTSSRAIVFDRDGAIRAVAQKEFAQIFPQAGWVEHDPQEIWASQIGVAVEALGRAHAAPRDVAAIGITNQRETTIIWDRETGEPIHNAIVWQDRRTAAACERLKAAGHLPIIQEKTGLLIDAYFSASKVQWMLDHIEGARAKAAAGRLAYGLEGSVFIGGAVVQWIRDGLNFVRSAPEIEALASSVADNGGVYLVPAFAGLGAPHWDPYARGTILGITRGTTSAHIARAALESIAYQVADLLDAMAADSGIALQELRVDGGAATNDMLMQTQADLLGVPVVRPAVTETTALGAAYLAGLAVGYWPSVDAVSGQWKVDRRFDPKMPRAAAQALRERWTAALGRSKAWERSA